MPASPDSAHVESVRPRRRGIGVQSSPLSCSGVNVGALEIDAVVVGDTHEALEDIREFVGNPCAIRSVDRIFVAILQVIVLDADDGAGEVPHLLRQFD